MIKSYVPKSSLYNLKVGDQFRIENRKELFLVCELYSSTGKISCLCEFGEEHSHLELERTTLVFSV